MVHIAEFSFKQIAIGKPHTFIVATIMSSTTTVTEWETSGHPHFSSPADKVAADSDLLTEILQRLPIKSLIRFKLVSKRWLSLITNPYFSRRRKSNPTPSGLFLHRNLLFPNDEYEFLSLNDDISTPPFTTLNFAQDPSGIRILQSCNGLLCCCSLLGNEKYYIYNPTTKQFTSLPQPELGHVFGTNLAFDPAKSPHYKVVWVRSSEVSSEHHQIEIYSSETGLWRVSGEPFLSSIDTDYDSGVYSNGAIHWISEWEDSLYFDIDQELLQTMPMPPIPEYCHQRIFSYFGDSRDHLHLIETNEPPTSQFNVYEMERDHSGWFVKYKVDLGSVAEAFLEMTSTDHDPMDWVYYNYSLLSVVRGEKEEDSFLVLHIKGKTIRYNFVDRTFKTLCDYDPADTKGVANTGLRFGGWYCAFQFIESLCCV